MAVEFKRLSTCNTGVSTLTFSCFSTDNFLFFVFFKNFKIVVHPYFCLKYIVLFCFALFLHIWHLLLSICFPAKAVSGYWGAVTFWKPHSWWTNLNSAYRITSLTFRDDASALLDSHGNSLLKCIFVELLFDMDFLLWKLLCICCTKSNHDNPDIESHFIYIIALLICTVL